MTRCPNCLRPPVPQEVWDATEPGEGDPSWCWDSASCWQTGEVPTRGEAYDRGRREERVAIVAWLREQAPGVAFTSWVLNAAEDIERGEHEVTK